MLEQPLPKKKTKKLPVKDARKILINEEANKLIDMDMWSKSHFRAEQTGIIFIDEIDKIASKGSSASGCFKGRVQRDILPVVEGSTVVTNTVGKNRSYFIHRGFHMSKLSI